MLEMIANTRIKTAPTRHAAMDPTVNLFSTLLTIAYYVILIIAWWQLFKKAGEKGWKAVIPFYNLYTQIKLTWSIKYFWIMIVLFILSVFGGVQTYITLLKYGLRIPNASMGLFTFYYVLFLAALIALLVFSIIAWYRLAKAYGHGGGYTVGLVFLPWVFILILGFGKSEYLGNVYLKEKEAKPQHK